jgi:tRNA (cytidine32/uridine32-2'-O)-methyltransferase
VAFLVEAGVLSDILIVLVETSHPGNIGAVARAMKTMGLNRLRLVNPKFFPSAEATARASGADDILANAGVFSSLADAISDCQRVYGASARSRTIAWPEATPSACAETLSHQTSGTLTAIVFGRENSGLNNEEIDLCQYRLKIPCNPRFSSLNLAAAVQVVCYELFVAASSLPEIAFTPKQPEAPLASAGQMASFYEHLQQTLVDIDFMHPDKSRSVMRRLRRIYNRIELDTKELDILRGILKMSQGNKGQK